jgi:MFS family permease
METGMSVSLVAREAGITASQLFQWRKAYTGRFAGQELSSFHMSKSVDNPAAAAAAHPEKRGWIVAALAIAQLVSWGSVYYGFSLFIVPMEQELGWNRTVLNAALSVGLLMSGLSAYPIGRWIDRHGGRAIMTLGSILASLLFVAWAFVASLPALFLIWLGFGVVMGATLYDPVFAVVTRSYPLSFRTKIIAITLVGGFASTVFIPLTQYFVTNLGWRHALLALAALNAAICIPIHALVLKEDAITTDDTHRHIHDTVKRDAVNRAFRHPSFWALMVCFTAYYANFAAMTFHLIPLLIERGVKTSVILLAMAVIGPAQVLARVILLAAGKRLSTAVMGNLVFAIFPISILLLIAFPSSTTALFCSVLLYGGMNGMITILRGTAVPDLLWKEEYGAINGLIAFPSNVAKAAGPLGAALIWSVASDYQPVLWTVFAIALLTAMSFGLAVAWTRSTR